MSYEIKMEDGEANYPEMKSLYMEHYAEMQHRCRAAGIHLGPYNPRLETYFAAAKGGWLLHFVVRTGEGVPVGYSNVYLTNDMHNGEFIATEDTVFITKEHRKGIGRLLVKEILGELNRRGVKRFNVTAATDPRATKLWQRMGFRLAGQAMTFIF
ncbi:MAG: GNAT family N-acetyltransferase [Aquamicrobium sp.]|uniref:GNAT family N-acetyltransferase n=1 Tax=Aquamicrobium sp. TaxID=1872579 RepID=UPI00349EF24A|nr:GNAT family N-acetyltransferase [Aquamicrobium sp.]